MSVPLSTLVGGGWRGQRGSSVDRANAQASEAAKRGSASVSDSPRNTATPTVDANCEGRVPWPYSPDRRRSSAKYYIGAIKSELYIRKGSVLVKSGSSDSGVGQIRLRLQYDLQRSDLIVQIIEVANLSSTCSKCYAEIRMITEDFETFRKLEGVLTSDVYTFQEKAKIPVASDELPRSTLKVLLFENAYGTRFIGEVELDLLENDPSAQVEVVADIENRPSADVYSFSEEEVSGELQVAVKYLPKAQRMVVTILQTRGMHVSDEMRLMDIWARVKLLRKSKSIKKKRTTSCQINSQLVFNQAVAFHLPDEDLQEVSVQILLIQGHFWKVTNTMIGQVLIGENSPLLSGRKQWKSLCKDREETAVWHRLIKYERYSQERRYSR